MNFIQHEEWHLKLYRFLAGAASFEFIYSLLAFVQWLHNITVSDHDYAQFENLKVGMGDIAEY